MTHFGDQAGATIEHTCRCLITHTAWVDHKTCFEPTTAYMQKCVLMISTEQMLAAVLVYYFKVNKRDCRNDPSFVFSLGSIWWKSDATFVIAKSQHKFSKSITLLRYEHFSTHLLSSSLSRWTGGPEGQRGRDLRWGIVIGPMTRVLNPLLANSYPRCGSRLYTVCPSWWSEFPLKPPNEAGGPVKLGRWGRGFGEEVSCSLSVLFVTPMSALVLTGSLF